MSDPTQLGVSEVLRSATCKDEECTVSDKTVAEQIAVVVHLSRTAGGNFAQIPIETLERWIREMAEEEEARALEAKANAEWEAWAGEPV